MAGLLLDEIFSRDVDTVYSDIVRLIEIDGQLCASVYDVKAVIIHDRNHTQWWQRALKKWPGMVYKLARPAGARHKTPVMDHPNMTQLMHRAITDRQVSFARKQCMLIGFEQASEQDCPRYIQARAEDDIHGDILKALGDKLCIDIHFTVGPYRVDMYVHELNVVVECDENDHSSYDTESEMARQEFITKELGCRWVRYNPYAVDFDVFAIISQILNSATIVNTF
jgi:very-short-patch-repair endonuclease